MPTMVVLSIDAVGRRSGVAVLLAWSLIFVFRFQSVASNQRFQF